MDGWLLAHPTSPENWFLTSDGERCSESMGNTCDRVFVYALYSMCIEASKVLAVDDELRNKLEAARAKLLLSRLDGTDSCRNGWKI